MAKICYVPKVFVGQQRDVIINAERLLQDYAQQNILITLRTLYYRFVALDLFPSDWKWKVADGKWVRDLNGTNNAEPNYKRLGDIIGQARLAGLLDWEHLHDRMRWLQSLQHFAGPQDALDKLTSWYHVDMWANQRYRPEIWVEKDALSGVVSGVCEENDVPYFCCRGYTSLSEMWRASMRLRGHLKAGQQPYIIHFGDHDPSGVDMSRDIFDRLSKTFLADCEFKRVALNMDQVEQYSPPPNPAKLTDSRCAAYIKQYGYESWELDALEPSLFRTLIQDEINEIREQAAWDADAKESASVKKGLQEVAKDWESIPRNKKRVATLEKELAEANAKLTKANKKRKKK